jgi:hypothetical protein
VPVGSFAGCHLRFNVLAFPSSRHTDSLTHFAAGAGVYKRKSLGGHSGAGGTASLQNGTRWRYDGG